MQGAVLSMRFLFFFCREWIKRDDCTFHMKRFIILDLCRIIHKLHNELQMAHGDLKPDNILVHTMTGRVQLIDFDRSCRTGEQICTESIKGGTPLYMSPERFLGTRAHPSLFLVLTFCSRL